MDVHCVSRRQRGLSQSIIRTRSRHWQQRQKQNPALFNGRIFILLRHHVADSQLIGEYAPTDFASYLYWREHDYCDASVRDGFGSAILRSAEGDILLGCAGAHTINAGRAYLPGGFVDARDVRADGTVDIDASVAREVLEETGILWSEFERRSGYWLSLSGPLLSIGIELVHADQSETLRRRITDHNAREERPEIAEILILRNAAAAADQRIMPYSRQVAEKFLAGT